MHSLQSALRSSPSEISERRRSTCRHCRPLVGAPLVLQALSLYDIVAHDSILLGLHESREAGRARVGNLCGWAIVQPFLLVFRIFCTTDIDGGRVERRGNVRGVVFLDHLDARAAIFGDLGRPRGAFCRSSGRLKFGQSLRSSLPRGDVRPRRVISSVPAGCFACPPTKGQSALAITWLSSRERPFSTIVTPRRS